MRHLTDHTVEDQSLEVWVSVVEDAYEYLIESPDRSFAARIEFQRGPINAGNPINGVTTEALIAICMDRLKHFQLSGYSCKENQGAIDYLGLALTFLKKRTFERVARGVEGTYGL